MGPSEVGYIIVTTTTDERDVAESIAERLVTSRLAACVQISGPLASHYVWNDVRERTQEWLCTIKTRAARFDDVRGAIEALHSYDTPEIVAIPMLALSAPYAAWIDAQTETSS